jgi:hypothetical protein
MAKMRHKEGDGDGAFKMRQEGDGDGAFKLQNVGSGLCLDPTGTTKPPSLASCTVPGISWTYRQVIRDAPLRFSLSPSLLSLTFSPSHLLSLSPLSPFYLPFPPLLLLFFSSSPSLLPWLLFSPLASFSQWLNDRAKRQRRRACNAVYASTWKDLACSTCGTASMLAVPRGRLTR